MISHDEKRILDELQYGLEKLQKEAGLGLNTFEYWATVVERSAYESGREFGSAEISFRMEHHKFRLRANSIMAFDCLIRSLERTIPRMPVTTKLFYMKVLSILVPQNKGSNAHGPSSR